MHVKADEPGRTPMSHLGSIALHLRRHLGKIIGVGAVAGIGAWHWETIRRNPIVGGVAAVAPLLLAAAVDFARKVWKEVEPGWVKACAEWSDAQARLLVSWLTSGFRRRYYRELTYRYRVFNVRGLRTQGTFTLELDKVFVELRIAPQNPQGAPAPLVGAAPRPENRSIWDFLAGEQEAYRCLAVIGSPGSGKTTLLQHLVLALARNQQRRHDRRCRALVPILLFLREHAEAIARESPPTLADLVDAHEREKGLRPPSGWFGNKLRAGKCLVLLDGLDEVASERKRKKVGAWVDQQVLSYPASRFVVTSRPHGYRAAPLLRATLVEVQPFADEQVRRFIDNWYLANEVLSFGKDDRGVRDRAAKHAGELVRRLHDAPGLAALAVNPLLLNMIAMVHRYRGALPGSRVELYAEICDVLLGHWQAAKDIEEALTPAKKRAVLQPLALRMMEQGLREIPAERAREVIREDLERVAPRRNSDPAAFLEAVEQGSGLLLEREAGVYGFAHLTFQEYLASAQVLEARREDVLRANVQDPWWHEAIRLYAAQADATGVVQACLDRSERDAGADRGVAMLTLAYECSREARSIEPGVSERLDRTILGGLESDDRDRGRLAAEVLLSLRLRNLLRLSDERDIDTSYISCAEYQLFLDDMLAAGEHRQPDHWDAPRFANGTALHPVVGVRRRDALAFCEWLAEWTKKRGNPSSRFGLPAMDEVRRHPPAHPGRSNPFAPGGGEDVIPWCSDGDLGSPVDLDRVLDRGGDTRVGNRLIPSPVNARLAALVYSRDFNFDNYIIYLFNLVLVVSIARTCTSAFARDFDLARDFDFARDRDLALDLARDFDLDFDFDLARDLARYSALALARDRRRCTVLLLLIICSAISLQDRPQPFLDRLLRRSRTDWRQSYMNARECLLRAYQTLSHLDRRAAGAEIAREGIRIVRTKPGRTASPGEAPKDR
jgi:energy-coupling factor transporter ATP-binding protein EcfA2